MDESSGATLLIAPTSFDYRKALSELLPIPGLEALVDSYLRNWGFCH